MNVLAKTCRYYKTYGAHFFWIRLKGVIQDYVFGALAPIFNRHMVIPHAHCECGDSMPDVILLAGIEWELRKQRPQQLAFALAEKGCRVHYCAPYSCASRVSGWRSHMPSARHAVFHVRFFARQRKSLGALLDAALEADMRASLNAYVASLAQNNAVLLLVEHPLWHEFIDWQKNFFCIYDCIDDYGDFVDAHPATNSCEQRLALSAGAITCTAQHLADKFTGKANVSLARNACEYSHFVRPFPAERDSGRRKVIGYHGAIAEWFDVDLLAMAAREFSEHTFLLVGAYSSEARERLAGLKNVELVGEVEYKRLPLYVHTFDVGLLPFRIQPLTLNTNPVKVYEYLAAGLPVVAAPLPEMNQFGELVATGEGQGFIDALRQTLAQPETMEAFSARQHFARQHTWEKRADDLLNVYRKHATGPNAQVTT